MPARLKRPVMVGPYTRKGRRVSGYRADRWRTMRLLSGGDEPRCSEGLCDAPFEDLTIAHVKEDPFSGYESRSGGAAYARWMKYVRAHPENYRVMCDTHHSEQDNRSVPSPRAHRGPGRKKVPFLPLSYTERNYINRSDLPKRAQRMSEMKDLIKLRRDER